MSGSSQKSREEEIDSRSGGSGNMDGGSGEDQDDHSRRKRYHRHTTKQIQKMEALFQQNPHPDDKERLKLSQELGLKPRQVKFWFQNRRTQLKAQQDRADNGVLRAENERLKSENLRLQAAMRNISCHTCGGPAILGELSCDVQHLRLENAHLREELDRICNMTSRYSSRRPSVFSSVHPAFQPPAVQPSLDLDMGVYARHFQESMASPSEMVAPMPMPESPAIGLLESEKAVAVELAITATDHLVRMSQCGEPLWLRLGEGDQEREVLNLEEHSRNFPWPIGLRQRLGNYRTEASRDSALVIMNAVSLVSAFLDANKWMEMFPAIVARARTIQVITPGLGSHVNGSLQLMYAEFQFPSPLVATRECYFLRFCSQQGADGIWVVVDFPVDGFHDATIQSPTSTTSLFPRYRRRPSGVIVQEVPNGYSKVTWVEHAELAEDRPQHQIFNHVVLSGAAYGARRWVANLQRHCERVASLMSPNTMDRDIGVTYSIEARRNIMHLARRMVRMFSLSISPAGSWSALTDGSADDTVRITTRKSTEPGQPQGVIICGVSSTWLPLSHIQVFELLRCEKRRSQMDALSGGYTLQEVVHFANGSHPGNYVSLLQVNSVNNSSSTTAELMVQESYIDASGSAVVYASIDTAGVNIAMSGEDTSFIPLLPSGFVMVPTASYYAGDFGYPSTSAMPGHGGCILIAVSQVLASSVPTSNISMATVITLNKHIFNVVRQVHAALGVSSPDLLPSVP
ncbi:homeobox-leucine zipper protein ROC3-like isoform X2 [Nymphaea colorata]|nr:homeobox-leucine zipper protein ROC3-like isoform X2 [Nymphaea colorata]